MKTLNKKQFFKQGIYVLTGQASNPYAGKAEQISINKICVFLSINYAYLIIGQYVAISYILSGKIFILVLNFYFLNSLKSLI